MPWRVRRPTGMPFAARLPIEGNKLRNLMDIDLPCQEAAAGLSTTGVGAASGAGVVLAVDRL